MHKILGCAYKSQDFAQSQKIFVLSHGRETLNFRDSGSTSILVLALLTV